MPSVGLNAAAAGMAAQQHRLDSLSNDLANVSTTGYKHVRVSFRDLVYQRAGGGAADGVQTGTGAAAADGGRSFAQGAVTETGRGLDVALNGPGFLQVTTPGGPALTRDGSLQIDGTGRLTTSSGAPLAPGITVPAGTSEDDLAIARDGTVTGRNGQALGRLAVVTVPAPHGLQPRGDNLFTATAASGAVRADNGATAVQQHALERSNVDMASAMTEMIEAQRSFELASRAIKTQDQLLEIANGVKR